MPNPSGFEVLAEISTNRLRILAIFVITFALTGCGKNAVETQLEVLTGNDYLAMDVSEQEAFLADSLEFFRDVHDDRSDFMCRSILEPEPLRELFHASADAAADNLLAYALNVKSLEWCLERGEVFK